MTLPSNTELNTTPSEKNRILPSLFFIQSLTGAAMIAASTVTSILGAELSGNDAMAGVPSAVILIAGAPAAIVWGLLWDRTGRRWGLSIGILTGLAGAFIALLGVRANTFPLLLVGMVGLGFLSAATRLSRFIAAEISTPAQRGRAISYVVMGGTVGAIVGPLLVSPGGQLAISLGLPELSGVFIISSILYLTSILISQWGIRPEPLQLSKVINAQDQSNDPAHGRARKITELVRVPGVIVAISVATLSQFIMVMIMGITALYMKHHGGTLGDISVVISAHTLGMYAFSIVTGRLADQWGRSPVIVLGALLLLGAVIIAPLSSQVPILVVALFLLGLGWNLCFVGGSALLSDHLTPAERSQTQGINDLLINLVSGLGSLGGGVLFAAVGYGLLTLSAGFFVLITLVVAVWWYWNARRLRLAQL